jgi:hypothetical protein
MKFRVQLELTLIADEVPLKVLPRSSDDPVGAGRFTKTMVA